MSYGRKVREVRERQQEREQLLNNLDSFEEKLNELENKLYKDESSISRVQQTSATPTTPKSKTRKSKQTSSVASSPGTAVIIPILEEAVKRQIRLCIRFAISQNPQSEFLVHLLESQSRSIDELERFYELAKLLSLLGDSTLGFGSFSQGDRLMLLSVLGFIP